MININIKKQFRDNLFAILSFLIPFYIYCYTLCPTVSLYADAGEFPTFAYVSGFAHPPGYPLFILILKAFLLLPFGNPALKSNLASAFLAALTIFFFYQLAKLLTKNKFAGLAAALTLAFSVFFWKSAVVSEVFSLLSLLIVLALWLFLLWQNTGRKKYFYWFLLIAGFGLGHHQTIIFTLLPLLVWFFLTKSWQKLSLKDYLLSPFLIIIGFLPYLYIWQVAKGWPLMNWENPATFNGLFRLFTRATYGSFRLTVLPSGLDPWQQSSLLFKLYLGSFSVLGIIVFLVGLAKSFDQNEKIFFSGLFVIFIFLTIFGLYSGISLTNPAEIGIVERFQIIAGIFVCLFIAYGLASFKKYPFLLFALPLLIFSSNFAKVNQRDNYFGEYLAEDLVKEIPPDSLFLFSGDGVINVLLYYRYVLGQRPDLELVIGSMINYPPDWYIKEVKNSYPDIIIPSKEQEPAQFLTDFLNLNSLHKNVFLLMSDVEHGLNVSYLKKPKGLVGQYFISDTQIDSLEELQLEMFLQNANNLKEFKQFPQDSPEDFYLHLYANQYILLADLNYYNFPEAKRYFEAAAKITPRNSNLWIELANLYERNGQLSQAVTTLKKALSFTTNRQIIEDINNRISKFNE